jgi:hypothetical protein
MEAPVLGGPFEAQIGLGRAAVRSVATMETARDAVGLEVTAGGDHFDLERIIAAALDLAQVG